MKPVGQWEKHQGRRDLAELLDDIKRKDVPLSGDIHVNIPANRLHLLCACLNTLSYKLSKEDKPFIPAQGKKNANHNKQDGLLEIANQIKNAISNDKLKSIHGQPVHGRNENRGGDANIPVPHKTGGTSLSSIGGNSGTEHPTGTHSGTVEEQLRQSKSAAWTTGTTSKPEPNGDVRHTETSRASAYTDTSD